MRHSKNQPQRSGVAVGSPGLVGSVQKHGQGVSAPTTGIWKHGLCKDGQSSCTLELPKSSYADSCKPFAVHPPELQSSGWCLCVVHTGEVVMTSQDSPSVWAMRLD